MPQNTNNFQNSIDGESVSLQKTLKNVNKYIAFYPAVVVQHRLIAGSCRPLRVLFIMR